MEFEFGELKLFSRRHAYVKTGKQIITELVTKGKKMTEKGQLKEPEESSWVEFWPHEA